MTRAGALTAARHVDPNPAPRGRHAVTQAAISQNWDLALDLFAAYRAAPEPDWAILGQMAATVMAWTTVLDSETHLLKQAGLPDASFLGPAAGRLAVVARLELLMPDDARHLARLCSKHHAGTTVFLRLEAAALKRLGEHEAAIDIGLQEWRAGRAGGAWIVTQNLLAQNDIEGCERFLSQAAQRHDAAASTAVIRARAALFAAKGQYGAAIACIGPRDGQETQPDLMALLASYAALGRDEALLDTLLADITLCAHDPNRSAMLVQAGPTILLSHFRASLQWDRLSAPFAALAARTLPPASAVTLARVAEIAGRRDLAYEVMQRTATAFPSVPASWRGLIGLLAVDSDTQSLETARNRMASSLPAHTTLATLTTCDPRAWPLATLSELIAHNLTYSASRTQFLKMLRRLALDETQIAQLQAMAETQTPDMELHLAFLGLPAHDRKKLNDATMAPIDFSVFAQNRDAARRQIGGCLSRLVDAKPPSLPASCFGLLASIESRSSHSAILTAECYHDAVSVARHIMESIENRAPLSAIRIGDGEGVFLPPHHAVADRIARDQADMQNVWWGAARMAPEQQGRIVADFMRAVQNAGIIGIMPHRSLADALLRGAGETRYDRGIFNGLAHFAAAEHVNALVTSANFPHDVHNWNLWADIFGTVHSVSYISCHDLTAPLHNGFGVTTRQAIHIPPEHKFGAVLTGAVIAHDCLLAQHESICAGLRPMPGELYLVAAGFLGKIYCEVIRQRGGIALDIGSLADYWMGFATRGNRILHQIEPGLPNLLIGQHPLRRDPDPARIAGAPGPAHSTVHFRFNIGNGTPPNPAKSRQRRTLRVIGHPRCASGYMAQIFGEHGIEIGHEKLRRDGISSWMHAVRDDVIPFGDNATCDTDFDYVVAHVRDPLDAIGSIMVENGKAASFNFRRLHILRDSAIDIALYGTALDRAVASLVLWYDIVMAQSPDIVIRVEDAPAHVGAFAARLRLPDGTPPAKSDPAWNPAWNMDANDPGPDMPRLGHIPYNSTRARAGLVKPAIAASDYAALSPDLRNRLMLFCARFGYAPPWTI